LAIVIILGVLVLTAVVALLYVFIRMKRRLNNANREKEILLGKGSTYIDLNKRYLK